MDLKAFLETLQTNFSSLGVWLDHNLFSTNTLTQLMALAGLLVIAGFAGRKMRQYYKAKKPFSRLIKPTPPVVKCVYAVCKPSAFVVVGGFSLGILSAIGVKSGFLDIIITLTFAWVVIRILTTFIQNPMWARTATILIWATTALDVLGLLAPTLAFLDSLSFHIGDLRLSALIIVKGIIALTVMLWLASRLSDITEKNLKKSRNLTPSAQVLLSKLVKIGLITSAFLIALTAVGIDLTAFAVFGGAVGLGLGFGLQKVVSNFISGIIILMDRSIKPGDVIQIGETYGWVTQLNSRSISLVTRDGTEYLIPNEDFITQQVINWSYSSKAVRIKAPFSVAYDSDPHLVQKVVIEAVTGMNRLVEGKIPVCNLMSFGDSAINFELRFWIEDPQKGIGNLRSAIYLKIWDTLKAHNIRIPYPQRDIHIKSAPPATGGQGSLL